MINDYDENFNYWAAEHYQIKVVSSNKADCMKLFKAECATYPPFQFGTHICSTDGSEEKYTIVIKRFKTKELCTKHLIFPPTYVREGRTV